MWTPLEQFQIISLVSLKTCINSNKSFPTPVGSIIIILLDDAMRFDFVFLL